MSVHLITSYHFQLQGPREDMREAINWLFDNCSEGWTLDHIADPNPDTDGWAVFSIILEGDRDAVLFKTFWNDR